MNTCSGRKIIGFWALKNEVKLYHCLLWWGALQEKSVRWPISTWCWRLWKLIFFNNFIPWCTLYTIWLDCTHLRSTWCCCWYYWKQVCFWVRKETSSSSENSFHFSKIVQKVKRKCKHLLLFFCGVLHKKSKACANNNNKIPKSMWIIDRATAERQITLWKISHQSLTGHPLERRIFLCHGIGSPGFLCYDQSPWCFQVQPPPFPQFWETYWRAVKTPSLKREMKKNPKCAPPFLFFASLSFVIPRATLKYSEKVKWNKWYRVKLSVSSPFTPTK